MTKRNFVSWLPAIIGVFILPRVDRWITDYFKLPEFALITIVVATVVLVFALSSLQREDRLKRHQKETGES
jgi:MFS superfamily sulfate permease-like transporter